MIDVSIFVLIIVAISLRLVAGIGGILGVLIPLQRQRQHVPPELRDYNKKLSVSVGSFIFICFGTMFFQLCRIGWIPHCYVEIILELLMFFNSLALFIAYYVMRQLVNYKPKIDTEAQKE